MQENNERMVDLSSEKHGRQKIWDVFSMLKEKELNTKF